MKRLPKRTRIDGTDDRPLDFNDLEQRENAAGDGVDSLPLIAKAAKTNMTTERHSQM